MKTFLKKLCLLAMTILFTLLAVELVLRVRPPAPRPDPAADRGLLFYSLAPERNHCWSRNATNVLRIAVIGDSFTQGSAVQSDDRYGARLEHMLNLNTGVPPVEVKIISQSGTSTFQQKKMLDQALAWNPAVVVLGICLNDAEDWTHPERIKRWRAEWMPHAPAGFLAFLMKHSRLATWVCSRFWAMDSSRRCVRYYRHLYDPEGAGVLRMRGALGYFREQCAAHQAVFVPVIWPLLSFDFSPGRYPMQFVHDAIHQMCREAGVPCLDLLSAFQGTIPKRMEVVPGIDPHPSEIAHRLAAEAIVRHLVDRGCIDTGYRFVPRRDNVIKRLMWENTARHIDLRPEVTAKDIATMGANALIEAEHAADEPAE